MNDSVDEAKVLNDVISALQPMSIEQRSRLIDTVATFYRLSLSQHHSSPAEASATSARPTNEGSATPRPSFSEDRSLSPKEFLLEKGPRTEAERIACLAYYLTHFRDIKYFQTSDLTDLNVEGAQIKLSNATARVFDATRDGFLAPAPGGKKQITALGERLVRALPEREAVREIIAKARPRRRRKQRAQPVSGSDQGEQ